MSIYIPRKEELTDEDRQCFPDCTDDEIIAIYTEAYYVAMYHEALIDNGWE